MSENNITVNVYGQNLVFRVWKDDWPILKKQHYVFFKGVGNQEIQIDNYTERITEDTRPNYIFDASGTSEIVYKNLDKCQLLILCLLSAESFYRVENNGFAKDQSVFKTHNDPPLREMTVEELVNFKKSKSNTYWIKNVNAFKFPQVMLDMNKMSDPSWRAKRSLALHIKELTDLVYKKYGILSFEQLIGELKKCSFYETIIKKYISYGQVVVYKCYQEVTEGRLRDNCYAMLAQTENINYQSELKLLWGDSTKTSEHGQQHATSEKITRLEFQNPRLYY